MFDWIDGFFDWIDNISDVIATVLLFYMFIAFVFLTFPFVVVGLAIKCKKKNEQLKDKLNDLVCSVIEPYWFSLS